MGQDELLCEAFSRIGQQVHAVLDGLSETQLTFRPDEMGNSIAWLVWHLARVQDDHIASAAGQEQIWTTKGWNDRFALPFEAEATGYGQSSEAVGQVHAGAELLTGYYDAVQETTLQYLQTLNPADYSRIVDERWDPPVSLGVRLISILTDDLQHIGQAAYVRGLLP